MADPARPGQKVAQSIDKAAAALLRAQRAAREAVGGQATAAGGDGAGADVHPAPPPPTGKGS